MWKPRNCQDMCRFNCYWPNKSAQSFTLRAQAKNGARLKFAFEHVLTRSCTESAQSISTFFIQFLFRSSVFYVCFAMQWDYWLPYAKEAETSTGNAALTDINTTTIDKYTVHLYCKAPAIVRVAGAATQLQRKVARPTTKSCSHMQFLLQRKYSHWAAT